jgi:salicylate hydroxylase
MSTSRKTEKVLIIGAGPGGLTLAQILRRYDIQYEIFERDESQRGRKQGWAVALIELVASKTC